MNQRVPDCCSGRDHGTRDFRGLGHAKDSLPHRCKGRTGAHASPYSHSTCLKYPSVFKLSTTTFTSEPS
jgi:hypothetical protein